MFLYLAHPIDQVKPGDYNSTLAIATASLVHMATAQRHTLFRPTRAYQLPSQPWHPEDSAKIDYVNRAAIGECDGLIAILIPGVPSLGVPAEIEHALGTGRGVLLVTTGAFAASSVQIASWVSRGAAILRMKETGEIDECVLADSIPVGFSELRLPLMPPPLPPALLYSGEAANLQTGKYHGDAGIDLAISEDTLIDPFGSARIKTNVQIAVPHGWFAWMCGRSSSFAKHGLRIQDAIIDAGYRGEMIVHVTNTNDGTVEVKAGMRLAQLILLPAFTGRVDWVTDLPLSERGENGWGSSGA